MFSRIFKMAASKIPAEAVQPVSVTEISAQYRSIRVNNPDKDALITIHQMLDQVLKMITLPTQHLPRAIKNVLDLEVELIQLEQIKAEEIEVNLAELGIRESDLQAMTAEQQGKLVTDLREVKKLERQLKLETQLNAAHQEEKRVARGIHDLMLCIHHYINMSRAHLAHAKQVFILSDKSQLQKVSFEEVVNIVQRCAATLHDSVTQRESVQVPAEGRDRPMAKVLTLLSGKMRVQASELLEEIGRARAEVDQVSLDAGRELVMQRLR